MTIAEITETRTAAGANTLLKRGYHLLEIAKTWRGPLYILGLPASGTTTRRP